MAAFEYVALDARGRQKRGVLEGDSPRAVRQQLREQALTPLEVSAVQGKEARKPGLGFRLGGNRMSVTELALFTRQLATLVRAGLPLETALQATAQQTDNRKTQRIVLGIRSRVTEGRALAESLGDFPQAFPEIYLATVAAGEQSGHLDGVLERLADHVETQQQLGRKVQAALIYPLILTVVAILVVIALMAKVVPDIVGVFESLNRDLPALTRGLIALSDFLRSYWWALLLLIAAAAVMWQIAMRGDDFRRRVHRNYLRLPLIGRLTRGVNTGRFTRTLAILVNSGVPVLDALRISGNVVANMPMQEAIGVAAERVREGSTIHRALGTEKLFPAITMHLIANGEASGELGEMLDRAAQHQEREVETLISNLLAVFGPLLILLMGGMVLTIVLAILLPIFDMNTLVK